MTLTSHGGISGFAPLAFAVVVVVWAWRWARWQRLGDATVALCFVLGTIALALLWRLRIELLPGVTLQLCGVALLHAIVGARLAAIGGAFAVLLAAAAGTFDLHELPMTFLRVVGLPSLVLGTATGLLARWRERAPLAVLFCVAIAGSGVASLAMSLATAMCASTDIAWSTILPAACLVASIEAQLSAIGVGVLVLARPGWLDPRAGATDPERLRVRAIRVTGPMR